MEIRIKQDETDRAVGLLTAVSQVFPEHVNDMLQLTRSCPYGISVEILPIKSNHTTSQRKYYWKWLREFAKFTGDTPDEMHDHILRECYGTVTVQTATGARIRPQQRSSESSRSEYSELIETLIITAANFDFVVPPAVRRGEEPF